MSRRTTSHTLTPEQRQARLDDAHQRLTAAVEQLRTSEDWLGYLAAMRKFHKYSTGTTRILDLSECPPSVVPNEVLGVGVAGRGARQTARADKLAETHDQLIAAIESLTSGEDWRRMLDVARQFHSYSFGNVMLILAQAPHATRVAGFKKWQQLGRFVQAGEHGIAILAPCTYRRKDSETEGCDEREEPTKVLRGFRVAYVFDVSQTDGAPLDDVAPVLLEGNAPDALWENLAQQVATAGFDLRREDCSPANGRTNYLSRTVLVRPDLSPAQAVKTLSHELAHVLLHEPSAGDQACRGVKEVEAESVAYLVCASAGLQTDGYTFPYVAGWASGDVATVRATGERVVACARGVAEAAGLLAPTTAVEST